MSRISTERGVSDGVRRFDRSALLCDGPGHYLSAVGQESELDLQPELDGRSLRGIPLGPPQPRQAAETEIEFRGLSCFYDRDALNDELPYWVTVAGRPHLVIPYSYETNDNRFDGNVGFSSADDFLTCMKDAFDILYAEGATEPRMMSLGLHDRLIGRPGRAAGLARFLDHVLKHDGVWICRGIDIARHWLKTHPHPSGS